MPDDRNELWITRSQAAQLIGLSPQQFNNVVRPKLGGKEVRGAGPATRYLGAAVVRIRYEQADDDPSMEPGAGNSPGLEMFRQENALLRRMDRLERERKLIPREKLQPSLLETANILRRANETLQRQYGNDAAMVINDAVDECEQTWIRLLTNPDGGDDGQSDAGAIEDDGQGDPHAPLAINAGVRRARDCDSIRSLCGPKIPMRSTAVRKAVV